MTFTLQFGERSDDGPLEEGPFDTYEEADARISELIVSGVSFGASIIDDDNPPVRADLDIPDDEPTA